MSNEKDQNALQEWESLRPLLEQHKHKENIFLNKKTVGEAFYPETIMRLEACGYKITTINGETLLLSKRVVHANDK